VDTALKALAEPRRREILRLVWSEEMPASQIAARFGDITRSAVSQHLGVLRGAELITERRDGTRRLYRANHAEMAKLRSFLDGFWADSLGRLRDLAEDAERKLPESQDRQDMQEMHRTSTRAATERASTTERKHTDG
jgi:DNA-binding transcriptional ArsR family regulator